MDYLFSLICLSMRPRKPTSSSIDRLSDEEVYTLISNKRREDAIGFFSDDSHMLSRDSIVYRIADDAVVKLGSIPEAFAMSYVSSHTSIPIPQVRRVLPLRPTNVTERYWIVMDLVDGEPLLREWQNLSWWRRLLMVFYMRSYIRQLHSIPIPRENIPGPFDPSGEPLECYGLLFTDDGTPPFNSYEEMADWYDRRRFDALVLHHRETGKILECAKFDRTQPLVVCHMDIHLGNIVVDRKGIPWLVDWAEAGAYPAWFEYIKATYKVRRPPTLWQWSYIFMFGNYQRYVDTFSYPMRHILDRMGVVDFSLDYFTSKGIQVD